MKFENIEIMKEICGKRNNNTPEKVFEFEFYTWMWHLLDTIHAFEMNTRDPLKERDYREMLGELERVYKELKSNIKYLERHRKK